MSRKKKAVIIILACIAEFLLDLSGYVTVMILSYIFGSVEPSLPEAGVWYCEEKSIMIDFRLHHQPMPGDYAVRFITDDREYYVPVQVNVDYGGEIFIESGDADQIIFMSGEGDYSDGKFTIHHENKNKDFVFTRTKYESIEEVKAKSKMY